MTLLKSSHSLTIVAVFFLLTVYHLENILLLRCSFNKSRKQTGSITIMVHELKHCTIRVMFFKGSGNGTEPFQ